MKKLYFRFRILLMTFAFGLASVFVINGSLKDSDEIRVDLPEIESESPVIVFPKEGILIPYCSGSIGEKPENMKYCVVSKS